MERVVRALGVVVALVGAVWLVYALLFVLLIE